MAPLISLQTSQTSIPDLFSDSPNLQPSPPIPGTMPPGERSIPNFLTKLWNMLEGRDWAAAIRWTAVGVGFVIVDPPLFSREVSQWVRILR